MSCDLALFDIRILGEMALAATLVITGIGFKRSTEQVYHSSSNSGMKNALILTGIGLYACGLALIGINLDRLVPENRQILWPSLIGILMSEISADFFNVPRFISDFLYAGSWLMLGYIASSHLESGYRYVGFLASGLAMFANFFALPYQRTHGIVDGIGLPSYLLAWSIIAILVSIPNANDIEEKGWGCLPMIKKSVPQLSDVLDELQCAYKKGCFKGVDKLDAVKLGKIFLCTESNGCFK